MEEKTIRGGLVLDSQQEVLLGKEASSIEQKASEVVVKSDGDFALAGEYTKNVKAVQKKVEEFWEPMRSSTYAAYKAVTDRKKAMLDPLKKADF